MVLDASQPRTYNSVTYLGSKSFTDFICALIIIVLLIFVFLIVLWLLAVSYLQFYCVHSLESCLIREFINLSRSE